MNTSVDINIPLTPFEGGFALESIRRFSLEIAFVPLRGQQRCKIVNR